MSWWTRLRELREDAGYSGVEFAAVLGVTPQELSDWERGRYKNPRLDTLERFARALGRPVADFFAGNHISEAEPAHGAHGQPIGRTGQEVADEKKSARVTAPVTRPVVHKAASSPAGPATGGVLDAARRKSRAPSRAFEPLPADEEIIHRFEDFGALLDRIINAFLAGEIRSDRTPEPDRTPAADATHRPRARAGRRRQSGGAS